MELVEKMTRRPTDLTWEQTLWGALGRELLFRFGGGGGGGGGGGVFIPVAPPPPPPPPLTGLNRFTLDDDKDEA